MKRVMKFLVGLTLFLGMALGKPDTGPMSLGQQQRYSNPISTNANNRPVTSTRTTVFECNSYTGPMSLGQQQQRYSNPTSTNTNNRPVASTRTTVFECNSCNYESDACLSMLFEPPLDRTSTDSAWAVRYDRDEGYFFYFNMSRALEDGLTAGTVSMTSIDVPGPKSTVVQVLHRSGLSEGLMLDVTNRYQKNNDSNSLTNTPAAATTSTSLLLNVTLTVSLDKGVRPDSVHSDSGLVLLDIQVNVLRGFNNINTTNSNHHSNSQADRDGSLQCDDVCRIAIAVPIAVLVPCVIIIGLVLYKKGRNKIIPQTTSESTALPMDTVDPVTSEKGANSSSEKIDPVTSEKAVTSISHEKIDPTTSANATTYCH